MYSRVPGPTKHDPFSPVGPPRTPGVWGYNDAGDPNCATAPGDTPGCVGVGDAAERLANHPGGACLTKPGFPGGIFLAQPGKLRIGVWAYRKGVLRFNKDFSKKDSELEWHHVIAIDSLNDLLEELKDAKLHGQKWYKLAIVARGDAGGKVQLEPKMTE